MANNLLPWEKQCVMKMMFYTANTQKFNNINVSKYLDAICRSLSMNSEEIVGANKMPLENAYLNLNALTKTSKDEIIKIMSNHIISAGNSDFQVLQLFTVVSSLMGKEV